ncbi:hypothetical protein GPECTOR_191g302 [Gonium pectorale]|uniref:Tyr recombinase domain-containing protein n=1 Tax=Gonium pectorale TaxID=33097 RepID=A0A150FYP1_GONPE|nr:hypothetical protein GPECTOR_191g302 [Gonium pectorale]|eukprot:KXZ42170.1 hypothetical protein GPECTOR_191g302 [Gonium pectorale]
MPLHPDAELRASALLGSLADEADDALNALAARFSQEADLALAASSLRQYLTPWRAFVKRWKLRRLPGTVYDVPPVVVGLYLYSVYISAAADGIGEGRVRAASGAIHAFFTAAGVTSPTSHPTCRTARRLAAKYLVPRPFRRDAFTSADLARLVGTFGGPVTGLRHLMMCAAVAIMFFGFLRFDDLAEVCVHTDLLIITESHMEIFLPRSKTDQLWKGAWVVVGRVGGAACPVGLTERLLERGAYRCSPSQPQEDVGPLLRVVQYTRTGGRLQRLVGTLAEPVYSNTYSAFAEALAQMCSKAGIPTHITPHSLRIGGNSAAAANGVPAEVHRAHGRCLSPDMVDLYTRRSPDAGIDLTRRMAGR